MEKKLFFALFLSASIAVYAAPCSLDQAITGKGIAPSSAEANRKADESIAEQINSSLRINSRDFFSQTEVDGVPTDSSSFLELAVAESILANRHNVQPLREYEDGEGNIVAERYICKSDAAKPYLDSLRIYLRTKLSAFGQQPLDLAKCAAAGKIYAKVLGWQGVLEELGQTDASLQREYEKIDSKIKNDCRQAAQEKPAVAVYMAGDEPQGAEGVHKVMGGELAKAISESKKYTAIDRTDAILQQLAAEHTYQRGGAVSEEQIKMLGAQLGAKFLCISEISRPGDAYYLVTRLIDVETAKLQRSVTATSYLRTTEEKIQAAQKIASELMDPRQQVRKKKAFLYSGIGAEVLGAGLVGYGLYRNSDIKRYIKSNRVEDAKDASTIRNVSYIGGGVLLLSGISIHIIF